MNNWKIVAIVFIIITILETLFIFWAFNLGTEMIEKENDCAINFCSDNDAYYYDDYEEICYCYDNNEIVKQRYVK